MGDLSYYFKIMNRLDKVEIGQLFNVNVTNGEHTMKQRNIRVGKNVKKILYRNRVVNEWNQVSEETVDAESVGIFEKLQTTEIQ